MFYISAGFILITGLPVLFFVAFLLVPTIPQYGLQAAVQTLEVVGLLCIIYALRAEP